MKVYRIEITSWTASFRYPNIISGYQPTLHVPPISTVLGLINSCAGHYLDFNGKEIGYFFDYQAESEDLETIYMVESKNGILNKNVKPNVVRRGFLFNCRLFIYLKNKEFLKYFESPYFQITLGRSCDLASICKVSERELSIKKLSNHIRGQIVPFIGNYLPGIIQALPQYFTNTLPRENLGTKPYSVVGHNSDTFETTLTGYTDIIDGNEVDIIFHKIDIGE